MRRIVQALAVAAFVAAILLITYLLAWPVPVQPMAWEAPSAPPPTGEWAPNEALARVTRLQVPSGDEGPEDVHEWGGGIVAGTRHGTLLHWPREGGEPTAIASTGGRPLGLHPAPDGALIIADAYEGLLRLSPEGRLTTLCDHATDGSPLVFTDDVDVQLDGTIWFTDASDRFPQKEWKHDVIESRPNGRLLVYRPGGPGCEVVYDQLYFANGVAIAEDERFVLINETSRYRVRRYWLQGPHAGKMDTLIENLPGFPDGISRGEDGLFWIAIASPRNAIIDGLSSQPFLRASLVRLPESLQPRPARHPFVIGIDATGAIVRTLQDPQGRSFGMVTSAQQHGDRLYLGSLTEPAAAWIRLD